MIERQLGQDTSRRGMRKKPPSQPPWAPGLLTASRLKLLAHIGIAFTGEAAALWAVRHASLRPADCRRRLTLLAKDISRRIGIGEE